MMRGTKALGVALLTATACGQGVDVGASFEQSEAGQIALNGITLNGISLNGVFLNGVFLNGVFLNGVSLNGVSLNGVSLNGVSLNGTTLSASGLTAQQMVGATFQGALSNGSTVTLRIDALTSGTGANSDIAYYTVSYDSGGGAWSPICGTDGAGAPIQAIATQGTWNYAQGVPGGGSYTPDASQFTLACRGGAIAKCAEMGYKPWLPLPSGSGSLVDHHVSCTRLIRADYCGDGTSYTVNGTPINVYDAIGIQADTEAWTIEAEWVPSGAACVSKRKNDRLSINGGRTPSCFKTKVTADCGLTSHFGAGTLLMDEFQAL